MGVPTLTQPVLIVSPSFLSKPILYSNCHRRHGQVKLKKTGSRNNDSGPELASEVKLKNSNRRKRQTTTLLRLKGRRRVRVVVARLAADCKRRGHRGG